MLVVLALPYFDLSEHLLRLSLEVVGRGHVPLGLILSNILLLLEVVAVGVLGILLIGTTLGVEVLVVF